jgi:large subunit ribosomal protein L17
MKHRVVGRRLDRTTEHRTAMLRNLVTSLLEHEKIKTTTPKAKELKRFADKIITLGKKGTAHSRRVAARDVRDTTILEKLFGDVAVRFKPRPGGYTRIIRVGRRAGDNADMAVIELVDRKKGAAEGEGTEKVEAKAEKKAEKKAAAPKAEKAAAPKAAKKKAGKGEEK